MSYGSSVEEFQTLLRGRDAEPGKREAGSGGGRQRGGCVRKRINTLESLQGVENAILNGATIRLEGALRMGSGSSWRQVAHVFTRQGLALRQYRGTSMA